MRSTLSLFALAFAVMLIAAPASAVASDAQQPATQQPAAQPAPPPGRMFGSDAGMMFNPIKPEAAADFEMVMGKLKEALAKSQDATRQQQAKSWKLFKAQEPGPAGSVLYIFIMDPAVKDADYTVSKILSEAFPTEVQALYQKYSAAYAGGQSLVNLTLVQTFGPGGGMDEVQLPASK
jgi:hypothetical protein